MPDLIRHPDVVPTKVGNHLKGWIPVFTGMTFLIEWSIYKQTLISVGNNSRKQRVDFFNIEAYHGHAFLKEVVLEITKRQN